MDLYQKLANNFFFFIGTNVIESEDHVLMIASKLKEIFRKFNKPFIFKVSFDKANRSSLESYRGVDIEKALPIFEKLRNMGLYILTDIHEPSQADILKDYVDIIQIPAFLARQTDLLIAAGKTGKIIHIKKGQFMNSNIMIKARNKVFSTGNKKVILCERGTMFGYSDLIVDSRNLIEMNTPENLLTMDITHCLQQPGLKNKSGVVCSGGLRRYVKDMGKLAITFNCHGIFMEVHDDPDKALCDGPTQFHLNMVEDLLRYFYTLHNSIKEINFTPLKKVTCFIPARLKSTRLPEKLIKKIDNVSIINRVIMQVLKCKNIDRIIVLTDDNIIKEDVYSINPEVECMIVKRKCKNGTDRILKFIKSSERNMLEYSKDVIVNVQGDEPFIDPYMIDDCIDNYKYNCMYNKMACSTMVFKIDKNTEHPSSRSVGKVVLDKDNNIMYCSRNIIPGTKLENYNNSYQYMGHIGVFVYNCDYLMNNFENKNNNSLQKSEDIEWLKLLQDGYKINAIIVNKPERSVDTIEDLNYLKFKYES